MTQNVTSFPQVQEFQQHDIGFYELVWAPNIMFNI